MDNHYSPSPPLPSNSPRRPFVLKRTANSTELNTLKVIPPGSSSDTKQTTKTCSDTEIPECTTQGEGHTVKSSTSIGQKRGGSRDVKNCKGNELQWLDSEISADEKESVTSFSSFEETVGSPPKYYNKWSKDVDDDVNFVESLNRDIQQRRGCGPGKRKSRSRLSEKNVKAKKSVDDLSQGRNSSAQDENVESPKKCDRRSRSVRTSCMVIKPGGKNESNSSSSVNKHNKSTAKSPHKRNTLKYREADEIETIEELIEYSDKDNQLTTDVLAEEFLKNLEFDDIVKSRFSEPSLNISTVDDGKHTCCDIVEDRPNSIATQVSSVTTNQSQSSISTPFGFSDAGSAFSTPRDSLVISCPPPSICSNGSFAFNDFATGSDVSITSDDSISASDLKALDDLVEETKSCTAVGDFPHQPYYRDSDSRLAPHADRDATLYDYSADWSDYESDCESSVSSTPEITSVRVANITNKKLPKARKQNAENEMSVVYPRKSKANHDLSRKPVAAKQAFFESDTVLYTHENDDNSSSDDFALEEADIESPFPSDPRIYNDDSFGAPCVDDVMSPDQSSIVVNQHSLLANQRDDYTRCMSPCIDGSDLPMIRIPLDSPRASSIESTSTSCDTTSRDTTRDSPSITGNDTTIEETDASKPPSGAKYKICCSARAKCGNCNCTYKAQHKKARDLKVLPMKTQMFSGSVIQPSETKSDTSVPLTPGRPSFGVGLEHQPCISRPVDRCSSRIRQKGKSPISHAPERITLQIAQVRDAPIPHTPERCLSRNGRLFDVAPGRKASCMEPNTAVSIHDHVGNPGKLNDQHISQGNRCKKEKFCASSKTYTQRKREIDCTSPERCVSRIGQDYDTGSAYVDESEMFNVFDAALHGTEFDHRTIDEARSFLIAQKKVLEQERNMLVKEKIGWALELNEQRNLDRLIGQDKNCQTNSKVIPQINRMMLSNKIVPGPVSPSNNDNKPPFVMKYTKRIKDKACRSLSTLKNSLISTDKTVNSVDRSRTPLPLIQPPATLGDHRPTSRLGVLEKKKSKGDIEESAPRTRSKSRSHRKRKQKHKNDADKSDNHGNQDKMSFIKAFQTYKSQSKTKVAPLKARTQQQEPPASHLNQTTDFSGFSREYEVATPSGRCSSRNASHTDAASSLFRDAPKLKKSNANVDLFKFFKGV